MQLGGMNVFECTCTLQHCKLKVRRFVVMQNVGHVQNAKCAFCHVISKKPELNVILSEHAKCATSPDISNRMCCVLTRCCFSQVMKIIIVRLASEIINLLDDN